MKKMVSLLVCLALLMALPMVGALADGERSADKIVVLYTNDVHCGINADEKTLGYADLAQYKSAIKGLTPYVTTVDCGDAVQGEAIGTLSKGSYIIEIMNSVGYDVCTLGNHEFDYGMPQLMALIGQSNAKYVCCNFTDATGDLLLDPYTIIDYDGLQIAYLGVVTPYTFTSSSPRNFMNDAGEFIYGFGQGEDGKALIAAVQKAADDARAEGADYVVAVAHLGYAEGAPMYSSVNVIQNTTGIDVVLDAHTHSVIPGSVYQNKDGKDVLLTSTGTKLAHIGQLVIDTKGTSDVSDDMMTSSLIDNAALAAVSGTIATIESGYADMLNAVVATTDVDLSILAENGNRLVRCRETNIGDLCADAFRVVSGADIAVVNGGGVRAGIKKGEVTYGAIFAVHPFGNTLCVVEATGRQILDALELAVSKTESVSETEKGATGESGGFLQVSGIKMTVDASIPTPVVRDEQNMFQAVEGERRVKEVLVLDGATGEYAPIDPDKTYALASTNYTIKLMGDGCNLFAQNTLLQDDVMLDNQVLITYITDFLGGHIGEEYAAPAWRIIIQ